MTGKTFTDDQITAIMAALILALDKGNSGLGRTDSAMYQAKDLMDILRGRPSAQQKFEERMKASREYMAETVRRRERLLASGLIHSATRDAA